MPIAAGEPVFTLRGRDPLAAEASRAWAALAHRAGAEPAVVEQALQQADALEAWEPKRLPDDAHLSEAERAQLAFQFSRRAWRARDDAADPRIMLAERRAFDAAIGRLRPILNALLAGASHDEATRIWSWTPPAGADGWLDPFFAAQRLEAFLREAELAERAGEAA